MAGTKSSRKKSGTTGTKNTRTFDKSTAIKRIDVAIGEAGVYTFDNDITGAKRVHIEWHPLAIVEGKHRRCFLGKTNVNDPATILGDGGQQIPRKGKSCCLAGRRAIVFGAGSFKVWIQHELGGEAGEITKRAGASSLMQLLNAQSGNERSSPGRGSEVTSTSASRVPPASSGRTR